MSTVIFFCRALPIIQSISNIKQWHFFCTFKSTFVISESFKTNKGNFCYNKIIFVLPFEALAGVCSRGQVTWLRSLLDWICQSKWDQICPSRGFACWAVCNESFWSLQIKEQSYMYIPSTLNIDLILWHTQLIVCAENVKSWFRSWVFPFTFQAYILPHTWNCMCVSLSIKRSIFQTFWRIHTLMLIYDSRPYFWLKIIKILKIESHSFWHIICD